MKPNPPPSDGRPPFAPAVSLPFWNPRLAVSLSRSRNAVVQIPGVRDKGLALRVFVISSLDAQCLAAARRPPSPHNLARPLTLHSPASNHASLLLGRGPMSGSGVHSAACHCVNWRAGVRPRSTSGDGRSSLPMYVLTEQRSTEVYSAALHTSTCAECFVRNTVSIFGRTTPDRGGHDAMTLATPGMKLQS